MLNKINEEVEKIQDNGARFFTKSIIQVVPERAWRLPSARDHHLSDERGEWGNAIHTLRVSRICDVFADILNLEQFQRDELKSAALLHDVAKHGPDATAPFIYKQHPQLVRALIDRTGVGHHGIIESCIEQHMGRWGEVPCDWEREKRISLAFLLHAADCIEARIPTIIGPEWEPANGGKK
jgi:23S rRNA maturation-related 3'-5' exoribonuclease YhaM